MCFPFQTPPSNSSVVCSEWILSHERWAVLLILASVLESVVNHNYDGAEDSQTGESQSQCMAHEEAWTGLGWIRPGAGNTCAISLFVCDES